MTRHVVAGFLLLAALIAPTPWANRALVAQQPVAFVDVNVFPMDRERVLERHTVVVRGDRIEALGPSGRVPIPEDAIRVDGRGRYLIPGLAEMHAHVPSPPVEPSATFAEDQASILFLYVAHGVTTVRGMLGHPQHLELRRRIERGELIGPRLWTSGPSVNGSSVPTVADARRVPAEQRAAGYDFLKIHPGLTREVFDTLVAAARAAGIGMAGHVPADVGVRRALEAGFLSIDHLDGYIEAMVPDADAGLPPSALFGINLIDRVDEARMAELARETVRAGVWNVATQILIEHRLIAEAPEAMARRPEMRYMPHATVAQWEQTVRQQRALPVLARGEEYIELRRRIIRALHAAGAGILLGSDAPQVMNVPGMAALQELESLVAAGLTPYEALQTGTRNVARFFGVEDRAGTVTVGGQADLVLLDGDPLADIRNVRRTAGVMIRGTWLPREELDRRLDGIAARNVAAVGGWNDSLPPLLDGMGAYRRPVASMTPEASRYFDQGLVMAYGFNSSESARAFRAAIRLDPDAPMGHFGLALAHSPTLDLSHNATRDGIAHAAVQAALERADRASPVERGLIQAFAIRFPEGGGGPVTDSAYVSAMRELWRAHPDDPDVGTLYAESMMLLMPQMYYTHRDTMPRPDTPEIARVLDRVLEDHPSHPGANHLAVHLWEASRSPERAAPAADRLRTIAPGVGHLLHMSGHIDFRTGRYQDAARANYAAWRADTVLFRRIGPDMSGVSAFGYHLHSMHFLWMSLQMDGQRSAALAAADSLAAKLPASSVNASNYFQSWAVAPLLVRARFLMWDEILAQPRPPANRPYQSAIDRYVRGAAHAAHGRLEDAAAELAELERAWHAFPANATVAPVNSGKRLLEVAVFSLRGRIAARQGRLDEAVAHLERAVELLDEEGRMDPPPWYLSVRQLLGAVLLDGGRAADAEQAFRQDLARHPDNGWSLRGLAASLRAQGRGHEVDAIERDFRVAWARADGEARLW